MNTRRQVIVRIADLCYRFTADGIVTVDGVHRPVDAVICSTGANVNYAPPFPITSGDLDLSRDWRPDGKFGWPYSYLGISTPGEKGDSVHGSAKLS